MRIAALAVVGVVALLLFKQYKPEWTTPLRLVLAVLLGGMAVTAVGEVLSFADGLVAGGGELPLHMWQIILKALGIAFVAEIAAGVCRDGGEGGLATWVETAGKLAILLLSLPLIEEILETVKALLGVG